MEKISNAHIVDNWVLCPYCFKKQFPVDEKTSILHLKYRCRSSRKESEHFMMINHEGVKK